jgi:uncharacterized membrane protein YsdA (DUF1294 family)
MYYLAIGAPILSIVTFGLYWFDRRQARRYGDRIPDAALLAFGQFGGWPGALLAQRVFHHKNTKPSFQMQFLATVVGNVTVVLVLGTWLYFVEPSL